MGSMVVDGGGGIVIGICENFEEVRNFGVF